MKLLYDSFKTPEIPGWERLERMWVDEAADRYQADEVYRGAAPPPDNGWGDDWAVVCTPDRIRYWKGLAPRIWSVPDHLEVLVPVVSLPVWALRVVSGETATVCEKVLKKYKETGIPDKAKKWAPLAKQAARHLDWLNDNPPELVERRTLPARVELGEGPSPYKLCGDVSALIARCAAAGRWSYDFEFGGDDAADEEEKDASLLPVGVSLSWAEGQAEYIPMNHESYDGNVPAGYVLPLLNMPGAVLWNAKADMQVQMAFAERGKAGGLGFEALRFFQSPPDDAMALSYLLSLQPLSLKKRTWIDYHHRMQPIKELIGEGKKRVPFSRVPVETAVSYGCQDADWTLRHWNDKWPLLYEEGQRIYQEIERPLTVILAHAQLKGMPFDRETLTDMYVESSLEKARLEEMIYTLAGVSWNIASNEQTADVLYKRLGLLPHAPTPSFQPSVSADALYPIARLHPVVPLILRWSTLNKLESAFYVKLLSLSGNLIHARMNQFIVGTGRLSSSEPNLQQLPPSIRKAFIGAPEIMAADESQLELRIQAALSQDPGMLAAYTSDPPVDLHDDTMRRTGIEDRRASKIVNFLTQYGGSAPKLQLGLWKQGIYWDLKRCQGLLDTFFEIRPRLRPYMREVVAFGEEHGYVETVWGRRRYVPEIHSSKPDERGHAERQMINHPTQGTGADKVKQAMVACWKEIIEGGAWMPLQVHDEILVLGRDLGRFQSVLKLALETPNPIAPVPLIADVKIGHNWLEAH